MRGKRTFGAHTMTRMADDDGQGRLCQIGPEKGRRPGGTLRGTVTQTLRKDTAEVPVDRHIGAVSRTHGRRGRRGGTRCLRGPLATLRMRGLKGHMTIGAMAQHQPGRKSSVDHRGRKPQQHQRQGCQDLHHVAHLDTRTVREFPSPQTKTSAPRDPSAGPWPSAPDQPRSATPPPPVAPSPTLVRRTALPAHASLAPSITPRR